MRAVRQVLKDEVWAHWKRVEKHASDDLRSDIRRSLPSDLSWSLCEVQPQDIEQFFIISSDDWADITGRTFRAVEVAARLRPAQFRFTYQSHRAGHSWKTRFSKFWWLS
jgi:hypothetical protein